MDQTYLNCINCGHKADLLDERKFTCTLCGGLYDVIHNRHRDDQRNFSDYTQLFDSRAEASQIRHDDSPLLRSGVWRFKEWIMPYLPTRDIITLNEGNVPIVRAGRNLREWIGQVELWMILEGMTPTGSFKDLGGTVMISIARAAGIKGIGCASTGDTSAMAAAYAGAAGMKCVVILPKGVVTAAQIAQPLVYGATIILLPTNFDGCMRVVRELVEAGLLFPANSLNPTRIEGHQATVFLTAQFFGWNLPDWFAVPVGNGSNCSSIGKGIRKMESFGYGLAGTMPKILGCQSEAAHPLSSTWQKLNSFQRTIDIAGWKEHYSPQKDIGITSATAALIGDPVSWEKVAREMIASNGAMNIAPEQLLNEAVGVCGRDGHFVCPQTGTALAGVKLAVADGTIPKGSRVVVVSTANGLKFTESAVAGLRHNIIEADDYRTETVARIMGL